MSGSFLPKAAQKLTEATSLALLAGLDRCQVGAIETAFVRQGIGESPILLVHGFDSSALEFRRLLPHLSAERETWAVDLLGFGFTDRPKNTAFSPKAIREHLYAFWKQCIGRKVILVGASMGGAAAIDFANAYPESVEALILLDSVGFTNGVPPFARYLIPPLDYLAVEALRSRTVRLQAARSAYWDRTWASEDAQICGALHLEMDGWRRAMVVFMKSGGFTFNEGEIAQLNLPTLILWGREDRILGTADAEKFQETIPGSKLIWIPDCGHVPHLEKAEITAQHILTFCREGVL
jgi:pimeloyl-ACP methyl ester carboxylesterase